MSATKTSLHESVSRALKYYKALRGKTNKDIAEALHIPEPSISTWNTGKHIPDMDRLQKLADYLDAPVDQFFEFTAQNQVDIDTELQELYEPLKEDYDLRAFLKLFSSLAVEDKALITHMATKLYKE